MLYPKIEDCVVAVGGKYTLTVMVAKRAKELIQKMPGEFSGEITRSGAKHKELTYALNEVATGKLVPVLATSS